MIWTTNMATNRIKLKEFTCWYFRYVLIPSGELVDMGIWSKKIKAKDFDDAWDRWWKQNPGGDLYRTLTDIEDENGVLYERISKIP